MREFARIMFNLDQPLTLNEIKLILTPLEWADRANLAYLYYLIRMSQDPLLTISDIAKEVGVSRVYILESVYLTTCMTPELKLLDRTTALNMLRHSKLVDLENEEVEEVEEIEEKEKGE